MAGISDILNLNWINESVRMDASNFVVIEEGKVKVEQVIQPQSSEQAHLLPTALSIPVLSASDQPTVEVEIGSTSGLKKSPVKQESVHAKMPTTLLASTSTNQWTIEAQRSPVPDIWMHHIFSTTPPAQVDATKKCNGPNKPCVCGQCDKETEAPEQSESKPHHCEYCSKSFSDRRNWCAHRRVHTGEKPFICERPDCGKRFSQKGSLQAHLRVHTGEKPYECKHCSKRFSDRRNWFTHTKLHSGERPFACRFCEKRFSRKDSLITHVRVHTGEKPFECKFCNKRFGDRRNFFAHIKGHTGERSYKCECCDKKFGQKATLLNHLRDMEHCRKPFQM